MDDLEERVIKAQQSKREMDCLIADYLPFIKKLVGSMTGFCLEYEDRLSIGMIVFASCVAQYQKGRGGFLAFVKVSIRNRILDEERKEKKNHGIYSLEEGMQGETVWDAGETFSIQYYDKKQEQERLCEEIESFSEIIAPYGITIADLVQNSPKQKRARITCNHAAELIIKDVEQRELLFRNQRISKTKLALQLKISPKTIEKHRKYIIALVLLKTGSYPGIRSFLPQGGEVKA